MGNLSGIHFLSFVDLLTSLIATAYGFGIYLFPAIAPEMIRDIGFDYLEMGITTGAIQAGFLTFALLSGFLTFALLSGFLTSLLGAVRPSKLIDSGGYTRTRKHQFDSGAGFELVFKLKRTYKLTLALNRMLKASLGIWI
ncbi:MAG: hypothetical protein V6Z81_06855 [Parvularculales bacterium]